LRLIKVLGFRVAGFFFAHCAKTGKNIPNYHKTYQTFETYIKWTKCP
jgi:hypothetical protein